MSDKKLPPIEYLNPSTGLYEIIPYGSKIHTIHVNGRYAHSQSLEESKGRTHTIKQSEVKP